VWNLSSNAPWGILPVGEPDTATAVAVGMIMSTPARRLRAMEEGHRVRSQLLF